MSSTMLSPAWRLTSTWTSWRSWWRCLTSGTSPTTIWQFGLASVGSCHISRWDRFKQISSLKYSCTGLLDVELPSLVTTTATTGEIMQKVTNWILKTVHIQVLYQIENVKTNLWIWRKLNLKNYWILMKCSFYNYRAIFIMVKKIITVLKIVYPCNFCKSTGCLQNTFVQGV